MVVELWGYKISEDGTIVGLQNSMLKLSNQIQIRINGESKNINTRKFIYYAFHQNEFNLFDKSVKVEFINEYAKSLYAIDNLRLVERNNKSSSYSKGLSKLTEEQLSNIKKIYMEKKKEDTGKEKNNPFTKISYRMLANKYGVSHTLIMSIVRGLGQNSEKGEKV